MDFKEYLHRGGSRRAFSEGVYLESGDYIKCESYKVGIDILTRIVIPEFNISYVHKNNDPVLYTTDDDGNPRVASVFRIKELN